MIDLDRGVTKRVTREGIAIHQYKDAPGEWYTSDGKRVSPDMASYAGFDTEAAEKERRRRDRISQATSMINAEFSGGERGKSVHSRGAFQVTEYGSGNYVVEDDEGNRLHQGYVSLDKGREIVDRMAGTKAAKADHPEGESPPERSEEAPADGEAMHDSDGDGVPDDAPVRRGPGRPRGS